MKGRIDEQKRAFLTNPRFARDQSLPPEANVYGRILRYPIADGTILCFQNSTIFKGSRDTMAIQPAAIKPKVNTVSLKHLAASLAGDHEMPKKQAEAILNDLVSLVSKHLKKGDRIRLAGLGILVVRRRAARMGRNPATGEPIQIKASKKVAFRAAKELKESI